MAVFKMSEETVMVSLQIEDENGIYIKDVNQISDEDLRHKVEAILTRMCAYTYLKLYGESVLIVYGEYDLEQYTDLYGTVTEDGHLYEIYTDGHGNMRALWKTYVN